MWTLLIIIAVCVFAWSKYKKAPTAYPKFFSHNKWITINIVIQILMSVVVAYTCSNMLSGATDLLMHDWVGDIVALLGFSDLSTLYGLAKEQGMFNDPERMNAITDALSPLMLANMVSSLCCFAVIIISLYTIINLKQKKFDVSRYFTLSVIGAVGIVISSYLLSSNFMYFQESLFNSNPDSSSSAISGWVSSAFCAAILCVCLYKYKKNLTAIFEETVDEVSQLQQNSVVPTASMPLSPLHEQPSETKQCPYCGETILAVAKKCKHCGEWFPEEKVEEEIKVKIIQCPVCGEDVEEGTEICPYCNERIAEYINLSKE